MTDFSKPDYLVCEQNPNLATCYDFARYASKDGRLCGREMEDWHGYLVDVICFPREFEELARVVAASTGETLASRVSYYEMRWGETGKTPEYHHQPGNALDRAGWLVSTCIRANTFNGIGQLRASIKSYRGGKFRVYLVGELARIGSSTGKVSQTHRGDSYREDAYQSDPAIQEVVENWADFFGRKYVEQMTGNARGMLPGNSQPKRLLGVPNRSAKKARLGHPSLTLPSFTPLSVLRNLPLSMVDSSPSYYVQAKPVQVVDKNRYSYEVAGSVRYRAIDIEIADEQGTRLCLSIEGKKLKGFLKGFTGDDSGELTDEDIRSGLQKVISQDKTCRMLVKLCSTKLYTGGSMPRYIHEWKWMYTDDS